VGYFFRPGSAPEGLLGLVLIIAPLLLNLLFGILSLRGAVSAVGKEQGFGAELTFFDPQLVRMQRTPIVREASSRKGTVESRREHRHERWLKIPAVSDYPILWKEMYFPLASFSAGLTVLCCGYPLVLLIIGAAEYSSKSMTGPLLTFLFWAVKTNMMLLLLMSTLKAVGTFNQERMQQTMAALFTLPLSHSAILLQKAFGSSMRFRSFLFHTYLLMLAYLVYAPNVFAPMIFLFSAQLGFFVMVGLSLSLSPLPSYVCKTLIGIYFFAAYFVLPMFFDQILLVSWPSFGGYVFLFATSPYSAWSYGVISDQVMVPISSTAMTVQNTAFMLLATGVVLLLMSVFLLFLCTKALRRWQEHLI
jgi:hypothetical protein